MGTVMVVCVGCSAKGESSRGEAMRAGLRLAERSRSKEVWSAAKALMLPDCDPEGDEMVVAVSCC